MRLFSTDKYIFILMSVQIRFNKVVKSNTLNECYRAFILMSVQNGVQSLHISIQLFDKISVFETGTRTISAGYTYMRSKSVEDF